MGTTFNAGITVGNKQVGVAPSIAAQQQKPPFAGGFSAGTTFAGPPASDRITAEVPPASTPPNPFGTGGFGSGLSGIGANLSAQSSPQGAFSSAGSGLLSGGPSFDFNMPQSPTLHDYAQSTIPGALNQNLLFGAMDAPGKMVGQLNDAFAYQTNQNAQNGMKRDLINGILGTIGGIGGGSGGGIRGFRDVASPQYAAMPGAGTGGSGGSGAGSGGGAGTTSGVNTSLLNANPRPNLYTITGNEKTNAYQASNNAAMQNWYGQGQQLAQAYGPNYTVDMMRAMGQPVNQPGNTGVVQRAPGGQTLIDGVAQGAAQPSTGTGSGSVGGGAPASGPVDGMAEVRSAITANGNTAQAMKPMSDALMAFQLNTGDPIRDAARSNAAGAIADSAGRDLTQGIEGLQLASQEENARQAIAQSNWLRSLQDDQMRNRIQQQSGQFNLLRQLMGSIA